MAETTGYSYSRFNQSEKALAVQQELFDCLSFTEPLSLHFPFTNKDFLTFPSDA